MKTLVIIFLCLFPFVAVADEFDIMVQEYNRITMEPLTPYPRPRIHSTLPIYRGPQGFYGYYWIHIPTTVYYPVPIFYGQSTQPLYIYQGMPSAMHSQIWWYYPVY